VFLRSGLAPEEMAYLRAYLRSVSPGIFEIYCA
jgi:hypothetical protein